MVIDAGMAFDLKIISLHYLIDWQNTGITIKMGDGEAIDSVEFFKHLTEVREDNDEVLSFYDGVAKTYDKTLEKMGICRNKRLLC